MAYKTIPALLLLLAVLHVSSPAVQGTYTHLPGLLSWVTISDTGDMWGVNSAQNIFHFENGNWVLKPGKQLVQVSAGKSGIWGVSQSQEVFIYRSGGVWNRMNGGIVRVSSGSTIWALKQDGSVFQFNGLNWIYEYGANLVDISVGEDGQVWGVNSANQIFRRESPGVWKQMPGLLKSIAVGAAGVWGANMYDEVFYWTGSDWQVVDGYLTQVDSGSALVGRNAAFDVFMRNAALSGGSMSNREESNVTTSSA